MEERKQNKVVKAETAGILEIESRNFSDVEASVSGLQDGVLSKEERLRDDDKGGEEANKVVKAEAAGSLETESRNFSDVEASVSGLQDSDSE